MSHGYAVAGDREADQRDQWFRLTKFGARAALDDGEELDAEDFPELTDEERRTPLREGGN
jgi:hypothetical protein